MSTIMETVSNASKLIRQAIGSAISSVHAGDDKMINRHASGTGMLSITSTAFEDGSPIPRQYTPQGANISPDLSWGNVPDGTKELVLIVEDPDAPMVNPFLHWLLHSIPADTQELPAGLAKRPRLSSPQGAIQGQNDTAACGWSGPKPPLGHGVHHYHFQLFAVSQQLNLGPDASLEDVKRAMQDHILADGEIVGTYERTAEKE